MDLNSRHAFAATIIAINLCSADTIHFKTQLRQPIKVAMKVRDPGRVTVSEGRCAWTLKVLVVGSAGVW
jgi:hypothetical protein